MKRVLSSIAILIVMALTSCVDFGEKINGNGNITKEQRTVNNADRIKVLGSIDVIVSKGPASVTVETDENLVPYIVTAVDGNWLEIKTKDNINLHTNNAIKVYVTTPNISDLRVSGSGNITCNNTFSTDNDITFKITGSGEIRADINSPKVDAEITGSGDLFVSGETRDVEVTITGSGNYHGNELKAENAEVKISGSGDASLFADSHLKASITGSGDVKYTGNASINKHVSGSGTISKI